MGNQDSEPLHYETPQVRRAQARRRRRFEIRLGTEVAAGGIIIVIFYLAMLIAIYRLWIE